MIIYLSLINSTTSKKVSMCGMRQNRMHIWLLEYFGSSAGYNPTLTTRSNNAWWRNQMEALFSPLKRQWRSVDVFFDLAWTNGCANRRNAGDLRCRRAPYDANMGLAILKTFNSGILQPLALVKVVDNMLFWEPYMYQAGAFTGSN